MNRIRLSETRVVQTRAGTMRTYASPTTSLTAPLAVWRTDMEPGAAGPTHTIDVDQVVVVIDGVLVVHLEGCEEEVPVGDSVVLPAGTERRLVAGRSGVVTLTSSPAGAIARAGDAEAVPVPWTR